MIDLTAARANAETTLVDVATITRAGAGEPTVDPGTGNMTSPADETIYTGPVSVSPMPASRLYELGGRIEVIGDHVVRLPMLVTGVHAGDVVTVDSVHAGGDPDLVGATFTIKAPANGTSRVLRHLGALRFVAGEGVTE